MWTCNISFAFVVFNYLDFNSKIIEFHSPRSGQLKVTREGETLYLDFPSDKISKWTSINNVISNCIGIVPTEVYKGKTDYIAILSDEYEVKNIIPNFPAIAELDARGLIITAKGKEIDFVSRFFAPQSGIDEDPVTGSAHTSLIPIWSSKLNKKKMIAKQLSQRGGKLICINNGSRCSIGGKAQLYLVGDIFI